MSEKLNKKLMQAVKNGDFITVQELLTQGANANFSDQRGVSVLMHAAKLNHLEIAKCLIEKGAQVDAVDKTRKTVLHYLEQSNNIALFELVISKKNNVEFIDATDNKNESALYRAVEAQNMVAVKFLLQYHANIDLVSETGRTAFLHAIKKNNPDMIRELIAAKANLKVLDNQQRSALHLFAAHVDSNVEILDDLLKGGLDIDQKDKKQQTPLLIAATHGRDELTRALVNKNANINAVDCQNRTALHSLAAQGKTALVDFFITKKADVNARDKDGMAAIHWATENSDANITRALIKAGAKVNGVFFHKRTALHRVIYQKGSPDIIDALVGAGAKLNAKDQNDSTPLHLALRHNYTTLAKRLLKFGANIMVASGNGSSVLHLSVIRENTVNLDSKRMRLFRKFIRLGVSVDTRDHYGNTPLHRAIEVTDMSSATVLLEQGADINAINHAGATPLYFAAQFSNRSFFDLCLSSEKVIVNTPSETGQSVLQFFDDTRDSEVSTLLRSRGALEHRENNQVGAVVNSAQSIHDRATEKSVRDSVLALKKNKTPDIIKKAYLDFEAFIKSENFEKDLVEISKTGFGEGLLRPHIEKMTHADRVLFLKKAFFGSEVQPGYLARMTAPGNTTIEHFKEVAGLVWLAITEKEHLNVFKNAGDIDESKELKEIRHTLWRGIVSIQYEYLEEDDKDINVMHPACGPGTINHHLAILNEIHGQVRVSNQKILKEQTKDDGLKGQLLQNGAERINTLIHNTFADNKTELDFIITHLTGAGDEQELNESCTQDMWVAFLENKLTVPRYQLRAMYSLPNNNPEEAIAGEIYFDRKGKYVVRDLRGKVQQDTLPENIDTSNIEGANNNMLRKKNILTVLSTKGQISGLRTNTVQQALERLLGALKATYNAAGWAENVALEDALKELPYEMLIEMLYKMMAPNKPVEGAGEAMMIDAENKAFEDSVWRNDLEDFISLRPPVTFYNIAASEKRTIEDEAYNPPNKRRCM